MAASVLIDAGFLIALLNRRDAHHVWARAQAQRFPPPWQSCEAVLSEAFHLLGSAATPTLASIIDRGAVTSPFRFDQHGRNVLRLMEKYSHVPMSFADACLVRMTEILTDPMLLTTESDFRAYRRHGRQTVPCVLPA